MIDWDSAPKGAMCFNGGKFWAVNIALCKHAYWCSLTDSWVYIDGGITKEADYENNLKLQEAFSRLADSISNIVNKPA